MAVAVGDVVTMEIIEVTGYACWGVVDGQIGFCHCYEYAWQGETGVVIPKVGELLRVKVFHISDVPMTRLPPDVSYDGKFDVRFAGSVKLLLPKPSLIEQEPPPPRKLPDPPTQMPYPGTSPLDEM